MKFPPWAFLAFGLLPLHAQQPQLHPPPLPPAQPRPPVQIPSQIPLDLIRKMGGGGFLDLRNKPAFRAVIQKKSVTPETFSITLKTPQGSSTYTEMTMDADAVKVVKHLVVGREYEFPKVFDDVLGKSSNATAASVAAPANTGLPSVLASMLPSTAAPRRGPGVDDLTKNAPFRARVAKLEVTANSVDLELHCTDGQRLTMQHIGVSAKQQEALRIARLLRQGETYEFPHAVLPETAGTEGKAVEPSPEMKVLEGFIGGWEMPLPHDPGRKAIVHYVWKQDGRGLWRETWEEPEKVNGGNVRGAWLITYDPVRKCYLETLTSDMPNPQLREMEIHWVPETRAQVLRGTTHLPEPGTNVMGRRALPSPDRLVWSFRYTKPDGSPVRETSGAYERVKR